MTELANSAHLEKTKELEIFVQLSKLLNETPDFNKAIETFVDAVMQLVKAEAGTFWFLDEEQDLILPLVARGPKADVLKGLSLHRGEGIAGQVIETKEAMLIKDVTQDSRWARRFDQHTGFVTRSMLVVPLLARSKPIGCIQLINKMEGVNFTGADLRKCEALVNYSAIIIQNKLFSELQDKFLMSVIKTLVSLVEVQDPQNRGHAERVCYYSLLIAEGLGLEQETKRIVHYAALLHDIGKIFQQEPEKHPTSGAQMVFQMEPKHISRQIWLGVIYHHEKYDGSGFPMGLKGEDIPLIARIICLADFFDRLNQNGGFQTLLHAVEALKQYSGCILDPHLVDIFSSEISKTLGVFS